jgi:hypothetical protein
MTKLLDIYIIVMDMMSVAMTPQTYIDAYTHVKTTANSEIQKLYGHFKNQLSTHVSSIPVGTKANDPFTSPPPFDIIGPLPPTIYIAPYNGYTIKNNNVNAVDTTVANSDLYYVIPKDSGNLYSKAQIGVTLKSWVPILDPYFGKVIVTHSDYSIINDNLVMLTFDLTFYALNTITVDSSISINLPILAFGTKVFESRTGCEMRFEFFDMGEYGGAFTDGRVVAARDKLIFYMYVFEKQRTYRIRGQMCYMLENIPSSSR